MAVDYCHGESTSWCDSIWKSRTTRHSWLDAPAVRDGRDGHGGTRSYTLTEFNFLKVSDE